MRGAGLGPAVRRPGLSRGQAGARTRAKPGHDRARGLCREDQPLTVVDAKGTLRLVRGTPRLWQLPPALPGRTFGLDLGLPFAEPAALQPAQEHRNPVGGNADQARAEDRQKVRGFLRGPSGGGDGGLVGEHVGDAVGVGVQEVVLGAAVGVHPQQVARRIRLDERRNRSTSLV